MNHYLKRIIEIFGKQFWMPQGTITHEGCMWYPLNTDFEFPPETPHFMRGRYEVKWHRIGCMERIRTSHHNCLIKTRPDNEPTMKLLTKKEIDTYLDMIVDKFPSGNAIYDHDDASKDKRVFRICGKNAVENYVLMNVLRNIWANPIAVIVMNELVRKYPEMDWIQILLHEAYTRPLIGYRHKQSTLIDYEHDSGLHNRDDVSGLYTRIKQAGAKSTKVTEGSVTMYGRFIYMQSLVSPKNVGTYFTYPLHGQMEPNYKMPATFMHQLMCNGWGCNDEMMRKYHIAKALPEDQRPMLLGNMTNNDKIDDKRLDEWLQQQIQRLFDANSLKVYFKMVVPPTVYTKVKTNLGIVERSTDSWRW